MRGLDGGEGVVEGLDVCVSLMMVGAVCDDVCALTTGNELCEGFAVVCKDVCASTMGKEVWEGFVNVVSAMVVWTACVESGGAVASAALQASDLVPSAFLALLRVVRGIANDGV